MSGQLTAIDVSYNKRKNAGTNSIDQRSSNAFVLAKDACYINQITKYHCFPIQFLVSDLLACSLC
jgi:hypothetical protein